MAKITSQYLHGGGYLPSPSFSTFDDNDDFWKSYNSLNSKYRSQLDPYLSYSYKEGIWDKIGNVFGFNTAADKYRFQMQDRARQVLAGLQNDVFQNDYNSAQEQASRQRDAGLNPDLSGESSGEGAAQLEQPLSPIDPSVFDMPQNFIPDLVSIFGSAAQGLSSVGSFMNLVSLVSKNKSERSNIEIKSLQDAWNYAGDYLSAFDPATRNDYGDVEITPDFFHQTIVPAAIQAFRSKVPGLSDQTYALIEKQLKARQNDPDIYDRYYKNYQAAQESRANKLAKEDFYGKLDVADDVIKSSNRITLGYLRSVQEMQLRLSNIVSAYNVQKFQNDWDFEKFKHDKGLPENLAESELQGYIQSIAESAAQTAQAKYKKDWLNYLAGLYRSGDPAAQYILNALHVGAFAPLQNVQFGVSPINGFNGSINRMIVPGVSNDPVSDSFGGIKNWFGN